MSDTTKYTFSQPTKPAYFEVKQDTPFVMDDGTIVIVRAGTLLPIAVPDGPPQIVKIER